MAHINANPPDTATLHCFFSFSAPSVWCIWPCSASTGTCGAGRFGHEHGRRLVEMDWGGGRVAPLDRVSR